MKNELSITTIYQVPIEKIEELIKSDNDLRHNTIEASRGLDESTMLNATIYWNESSKKWYFDFYKTRDGKLLEVVTCGVINFGEKAKDLFEKEKVMDSPLLSNILKTMLIDYYYNKTDNKDYIVDDRDLLEKITSNTK